ncbi:MAG: hypothetical protein WCT04_23230 [Planctomycetota bacterium]
MIVLHGIYKFSKTLIGSQNCFCKSCNSEQSAEQFRTFNAWHVFFIPVLPLGYQQSWCCKKCGNDPHARTITSPLLLMIAIILFGVLGLLLLGSSLSAKGMDRTMFLCVGGGLTAFAMLMWFILWLQQKSQSNPIDVEKK